MNIGSLFALEVCKTYDVFRMTLAIAREVGLDEEKMARLNMPLWYTPLILMCRNSWGKNRDPTWEEKFNETCKSVATTGIVTSADHETWRKILHYVLSNEESMTNLIAGNYQDLKDLKAESVECDKVIEQFLPTDQLPVTLNVGLKCWYFVQVWKLILAFRASRASEKLESHSATTISREYFVETVSKQETAIVEFVDWLVGANYSLDEFLLVVVETDLLSCLWTIVYQFLASPSWSLVKQEILSLV